MTLLLSHVTTPSNIRCFTLPHSLVGSEEKIGRFCCNYYKRKILHIYTSELWTEGWSCSINAYCSYTIKLFVWKSVSWIRSCFLLSCGGKNADFFWARAMRTYQSRCNKARDLLAKTKSLKNKKHTRQSDVDLFFFVKIWSPRPFQKVIDVTVAQLFWISLQHCS